MGFLKKKLVRYWEAQDTPPNYFNIPVEETQYRVCGFWIWTSRRVLKPEEVSKRWGGKA